MRVAGYILLGLVPLLSYWILMELFNDEEIYSKY